MFELIFGGVFLIVVCMIGWQWVNGLAEWNRNNHAPVEERRARVAGKREEVHHHTHTNADGSMHTSVSTTCYATFETEDGVRMELRVGGREYKMLTEGDRGVLRYQGTRYLGFAHRGKIS
ncbi:MAG: DUF2500 domain-containing protein [Butyricicoccus sp.]|nr:DUF2500 domain-containing protein [Butyricicoccus sp.]